MEKGEMRVEANISISKDDSFGTKVEVKNLNSFKAVEKAIEYEIKRQAEILESGERVIQETRGYDENKGVTFSQRKKEESHDYRYFPDPDLPKLKLSLIDEFRREEVDKDLPELPWQKRERFINDYKLKAEDVEFFVRNREWASFFEEIAKGLMGKEGFKLASNYITSDLVGLSTLRTAISKDGVGELNSKEFVILIKMVLDRKLSSRGAKNLLQVLFEKGGKAEEVAVDSNLIQVEDRGKIKSIVLRVISNNKEVVEDYKRGKETALKFLIGQVMKESAGSFNPILIKEILIENLK